MPEKTVQLGILCPSYSAEDDYPAAAKLLGPAVGIHVVHKEIGEDAHREDALRNMGSLERLRPGAALLRAQAINAAMWDCTSGSFVFGLKGAMWQVEQLQRELEVPVSSTSLAFLQALRALEITRVAVAATYPMEVAQLFCRFLEESEGPEVVHFASLGIIMGVEVARLDRDRVLSLALASDHPRAQAILLPDTALHTVQWLGELEAAARKPVLTANQVTVWEGLRLAGYHAPQRPRSLGTLFARL